ncbi:MAG: hypothetical protein QGF36_07090, partial [Candidatus Marinimicrobia bacterium]|nr:hypothetical protein [Candidatus Neomarinimicrobiota bacterium]
VCGITNPMPDTPGCTFEAACNYDPEAVVNDGSCWFPNLGCECENGQNAVVDNCGTCNLEPTDDCTIDCMGLWGGEASLDDCGVCSGGTSDHESNIDKDCAEVCWGSSYIDNCGVCDADPENDCPADCAGVYDGVAILDNCGVCLCNGQDSEEGNGCEDVEPCEQDCAGVWGGIGELDLFGDCCTENCILTGCDLP